jgi:hypothetical protein
MSRFQVDASFPTTWNDLQACTRNTHPRERDIESSDRGREMSCSAEIVIVGHILHLKILYQRITIYKTMCEQCIYRERKSKNSRRANGASTLAIH